MAIKKYRTSIFLALYFTVLLSTFWFMPQLAFIIFISLLLQLLLQPIVNRLTVRIPRALAAGLALVLFISLGLILLGLVSKSFIPTLSRFVTDFPQLSEQVQNISWLHDSEFLRSQLDDIWTEMREVSVEALKSSLAMLLSLFNKAIDLVIILFVTFYLLKDGEQIKKYLASLFPTKDYSRVLRLFNRILDALRIYICSQLVICCITAVIVFLYFTIRQIPYASVFAVVSGICEFIPVLGPTVASAFGTILTATINPIVALQTAGFYLLLTQINHNFIYPTLIGKSLNLHPIAIILGIVLGGELLGAAGMFLSVPFIVICKLVIEDIYKDRVMIREQEKASRWLAKKNEE